jgi:signal transduction histidine kinase
MASFVINCPWCREDSKFTVDNLNQALIPPLHVNLDADGVFEEVEKKCPLFGCKNSDCWAPFQAMIAKGLENAKTVEKLASRVAWSSPRRFRLAKDREGARYDDVYGVLFNRQPLPRRKEIHLSSLVDVPIIAKFLSAHAWRFGGPVTLFEAWATDVGRKLYWIPVQPLGPPDLQSPVPIGTSHKYRPECRECRRVFEAKALEALRTDGRIGENCPHFDRCPAMRACLNEPWPSANISDRCLRWLELREQDNPCWQSDLKIIDEMVNGLMKGDVSPMEPYRAKCWTRYLEICFPLLVHDHLVGAVMIGQFDTDESPRRAETFAAHEAEWQLSRSGQGQSGPLLAGHLDALRQALEESYAPNARAQALTGEQNRDIREDVRNLAVLTGERYLRHRDLLESAFRSELAGTLTLRLLKRQAFGDLLPWLLRRMRDFWAFEHVCLCMMGDADDHPTLHATETRWFPGPKPALHVPNLVQKVREYGSHDILLATALLKGPETQIWRDFRDALVPEIADSAAQQADLAAQQAVVIGTHVGQRSYVFCFFGRDATQLSGLPHSSAEPFRVSRECREQVMRTCEQVAGQLHNFWARYDQELAYRVLSHSLRFPVALMKKGAGTLRRLVELHRASIQNRYPDLYDAAQELCESLRLGSREVDDDLRSLGATANLASFLENARKGQTDLVKLLEELAPQCRWRSRAGSKIVKRPVTWDFRLSGTACVRGDRDAIGLAVRNVLDNAFKYSYPGREISVEIFHVPEGCELVVTNFGVPVDPDEDAMIWQRDYRGRHARRRRGKAEEGTGYGLFIVRQIVEASGGGVSLETEILSTDLGRTTVRLLFTTVEED